MKTEAYIWLERLSSLHHSLMRKAASAEGMQLVHIEILEYLSLCNRYSNTAQALSEYLGQTKGSISQSIKFLDKQGFIERRPCPDDKRIIRLYLTSKSRAVLARIRKILSPDLGNDNDRINALKSILSTWQRQTGSQGFGLCHTCRFNLDQGQGLFQCGLTGEPLRPFETAQICREHEFANS